MLLLNLPVLAAAKRVPEMAWVVLRSWGGWRRNFHKGGSLLWNMIREQVTANPQQNGSFVQICFYFQQYFNE
jgi:hypothetical protein